VQAGKPLSPDKRVDLFFRTYLHHVKGEWARPDPETGLIPPFELARWQSARIVKPLFGTLRRDGLRRYRTCYCEVPRKNGKSTFAAGIGLYLLFADQEPGAEIYSAAADKDQGRVVFDQAKQMVENEPRLKRQAHVFKDAIEVRGSVYRVISADAFTKHGLNAHGILFDELHAQPNRELYDVLTTSTGARSQPIVFMMTTAGFDRNSICYEIHDYAEKVMAGIIDDPTFLPVIFAAGKDDDWHDEAVWKRANPNLEVSKKIDYMREKHLQACSIPGYENTFKRLDLNIWTQQANRWLPMDQWDVAAQAEPVADEWFAKKEAFGGLDLASTTDLASFCLDFVDAKSKEHRVRWWHWIAAENAHERERRDRVPYPVWSKQGFIKLTPGNVIDYDVIREDIKAIGKQFNVKEIAYDRWNAQQLVTQLEGDGFTMVPVGMGFASLTAPSKHLENLIKDAKLRHGGNPVARWCASNVAVEIDAAENKKPSKKHSTEKIDAIIALILAIARAMLQPEAKPSVYETRGIIRAE
jgi:phage terminase large subunit-like protein